MEIKLCPVPGHDSYNLQRAIDACEEGDTIHLESGNYDLTKSIVVPAHVDLKPIVKAIRGNNNG